MRDHTPLVIEEFGGFFARGDVDACPRDHFPDCENISFIESGVRTRDGVQTFYNLDVFRMYPFKTAQDDGFLALDTSGQIHHLITSGTTSLAADHVIAAFPPHINDFFMLNFDNRAYISPIQIGEDPQMWLYVYQPKPPSYPPARPAGGQHPVAADGALRAAQGGPGNVEAGIHLFAAVYETDTGFLTAPGDVIAQVQVPGTTDVLLTGIPVSPNSYVINVWLAATKAIDPTLFTGDLKGYELFFIPGAVYPNGTTTATVNFFDSELLTSASDLFDLKDQIPAGSGPLGLYHGRMTLVGEQAASGDLTTSDPDIVWISNPGEPEAFNAVSGFVTLPHDGLGITQAFEYRDVLYVSKVNALYAFGDNGGDPVDWPQSIIEGGLGCVAHGLAATRQNDSLDIEYVILMNQSGVFNFQGIFMRPMGELSYKIRDFFIGSTSTFPFGVLPGWPQMDELQMNAQYQIVNDVYNQLVIISMTDRGILLVGDYKNGLDPKSIRWTKWQLQSTISTIAMHALKNVLFIGSGDAGISLIVYNSGKTNDTIYTSVPGNTTANIAIPDPFLRTAFIGD